MDWKPRVKAAFAAGTVPDEDVIEELAQHAADAYQAALAENQAPAEAARRVEAQVAAWAANAGSLRHPRRSVAQLAPPASSTSRLAGLLHDARYALRLLRRQPGFTFAAVGTMALGIGATTVIFSVLYGVLLKPLPWPGGDRLVRLSETRQGGLNRFGAILTNATFLAWRQRPETVEHLAAWSGSTCTFSDGRAAERVLVANVSASLFPLMGARAELGALFTAPDEVTGGTPPVVISHGLWQQRFGSSASAIGRMVRLDGRGYRIVAVMSASFAFPKPDTRAWVPFFVPPVSDGKTPGRMLSMFGALARLRPGVTPARAAAEGTARARHGEDLGLVGIAVFGSNGPVTVSAEPLLQAQTAEVKPALVIFLAAVGLLLATATANVASLQLARAAGRRREIAIRSALGAGTGRLARQFLVESAIVGLAGGGLGVAMTAAVHRALPSLLPPDFPRLAEVALNVPVLAMALAVSVVSGLAFGIWPSLHARRLSLVESLGEDGMAPIGGSLRSRAGRARSLVMVVQVACACVLLLGAALLTRSLVAQFRADRGYDPRNVLTAALTLPETSYTGTRRAQLATALLERLRAVPGVRAAAVTATLPLTPGEMLGGFTMPSRNGTGTRQVRAAIRHVSAGYFETLGIRLVAGRTFSGGDTAASQPVVVVNRSFVRQYLDEPAVGQRLPSGEIVGVVEDVRQRGVSDVVQPEVYLAWAQLKEGLTADEPKVVVRADSDPRPLVSALRGLVRAQDPAVALDDVRTMEERVSLNLARPRLYAVLLGGFAGCALIIAAVGLFGVLSHGVVQRSREIGVRAALGARPARIVRLVVAQGLRVTAAGVAAGLVLSFAVLKYLSTLLYGVTVYDPWSYVLVLVVVTLVSALACAIPARRAAKADPLQALRT